MTRARVAELLRDAVYRVVRRAPPLPTVEAFLDLPLTGILPGSSPRDWPSFWKETLVAAIAEDFRKEGFRIDGFDARVFLRWNRKMRSICDWIAERLMPLAPASGAHERPSSPGPWLLMVFALALWAGPAGAEDSLEGTRAAFERTPPERPESAEFLHDIRVAFRSARGRTVDVPVFFASDPVRYIVTSSCAPEERVLAEKVVWLGVGREEGTATGAVLYGSFDPACACTLAISMPGFPEIRVPVAADGEVVPAPAAGFVRFVRFIDRHLSGTLDLRTLENEENLVGIDLRSQVEFPVAGEELFADVVQCQLSVEGMLAAERSARRAHNALDAEFSLNWLRHYRMPGPAWAGRYVQAVGFQLAPLGFESDQNLRTVDLTAGPAVTLSLPFLDPLLLAWHRLIEMPRGFLPPTVRVGYTHLHRIGGEPSARRDRGRIDLELVALAPLLRPLDLEARYRVYHDLTDHREESILELSWKWYVADETRTAVLLKLVHGALPPAFREADLVGVGFALGL